jgi:hypothetical protein
MAGNTDDADKIAGSNQGRANDVVELPQIDLIVDRWPAVRHRPTMTNNCLWTRARGTWLCDRLFRLRSLRPTRTPGPAKIQPAHSVEVSF